MLGAVCVGAGRPRVDIVDLVNNDENARAVHLISPIDRERTSTATTTTLQKHLFDMDLSVQV